MIAVILVFCATASIGKSAKTKGNGPSTKEPSQTESEASLSNRYFVLFCQSGQVSRGDIGSAKEIAAIGSEGTILSVQPDKSRLYAGDLLVDCAKSNFSIDNRLERISMNYGSETLIQQLPDGNDKIDCLRESDTVQLLDGRTVTVNEGQELVISPDPLNGTQPASFQLSHILKNDFAAKLLSERDRYVGKDAKCADSSEPTRILAEEGAEFGLAERKSIAMNLGNALFCVPAGTKICTAAGEIESNAMGLVLVRQTQEFLYLENCSTKAKIHFSTSGHDVHLGLGEECILMQGNPNENVSTKFDLERRHPNAYFDGQLGLIRSEFSLLSLALEFPPLHEALKHPISSYQKYIASSFCKTAAALSVATEGNGEFRRDLSKLPVSEWGAFKDPLTF